MQSKRVRERGRHGRHGRVPGYLGTYLVSFWGVLGSFAAADPAQAASAKARSLGSQGQAK